MPNRIAIIGAGPSGILTLRALKHLHEDGQAELVAFEKQSKFGGLWCGYNEETGLDRWGLKCHGGQYNHLWINSPRQCIELGDLPQPDDWPSYVPGKKITEWWRQFVDKFGLTKFMRLNTLVTWVAFDDATGKFKVTVTPYGKEPITEAFDYVIVATGHFSYPHEPHFPGMETFNGEISHSHDYRDGSKYRGKRVLCVGGAYSAEDIALQVWKYGASKVTITSRTSTGHTWPEGIDEKPIVTRFDGRTAYFPDGSCGEYDAVILCTGYEHHFPFMADNLKLNTGNSFVVPLYYMTVFPDNTKLFYIGMPDQYFAYPMFLAQAQYIDKILQGKIKLPSKPEMLEYIKKEKAELEKQNTHEELVLFQARHVNALTEAAGTQNLDVSSLFIEWLARKREGILTFRDAVHTSLKTGRTAPKTEETWMDALARECR